MQMATSGIRIHSNKHTYCSARVASHPDSAGNYLRSQDATRASYHWTPTSLTDDVVIYVQTLWHTKPGDYGNEQRWLTALYARVRRYPFRFRCLGGLEGDVMVRAPSKYLSVWLATKHYNWKRSYLPDLCHSIAIQDDSALGGLDVIRWLFMKADFYIIICLVRVFFVFF